MSLAIELFAKFLLAPRAAEAPRWGNRFFFANTDAPLALYPDLTGQGDYPEREAGSCAPFVWGEAHVRPVWQWLADRAALLGSPIPRSTTNTDPALRLSTNGITITPFYSDAERSIFALPSGAAQVRLISRAQRATQARPWLEDRRILGVCVAGITIRGGGVVRSVALDGPLLAEGWWDVERHNGALRRWTKGDAALPLARLNGPATLEVQLGDAMTYAAETGHMPLRQTA